MFPIIILICYVFCMPPLEQDTTKKGWVYKNALRYMRCTRYIRSIRWMVFEITFFSQQANNNLSSHWYYTSLSLSKLDFSKLYYVNITSSAFQATTACVAFIWAVFSYWQLSTIITWVKGCQLWMVWERKWFVWLMTGIVNDRYDQWPVWLITSMVNDRYGQ